MSSCRRGFKLIDLMVLVFVLAVSLALVPNVLRNGQIEGRRTACSNNMRQFALGLLNFLNTKNQFPNAGTFRDDPEIHQGDPSKSNIYRSIVDPRALPHVAQSWRYNWAVEIMPYIDEPDIANAWDKGAPYWWPTSTISGQPANLILSNTPLGLLRCPDDPTLHAGEGNLSYVANGGFTRWTAIPVGWSGSRIDGQSGNGGVRQWAPVGSNWRESQEVGRQLGVMFLGTETGSQPWDLKTTAKSLSDGASNTLLLGENTLVGASAGNRYSHGVVTNWACPLPNFAMFVASDDVCTTDRSANDCLGGQLALRPGQIDGPGWARTNHPRSYERINFGRKLSVEGSFPFINSNHPLGANFLFCDGAVRFVDDTIDGTVYAKMITPAGGRLPDAIR